ncbi:hypothetical protein C8Q79DRAFT_1043935 [Trametes meyenii]|nr:hypothetical protein C8Q79DRAFT_1043935 [Trametes meyenii]
MDTDTDTSYSSQEELWQLEMVEYLRAMSYSSLALFGNYHSYAIKVILVLNKGEIIEWIVSAGMAPVFASICAARMGSRLSYGDEPRATNYHDGREVAVTTRSAMFLFEAIVIVETWRKTWRTVRSAPLGNGFQNSLSAIVFREGTIYFVIIEICTVVNTINDSLSNIDVSILALLLSAAPSILISRFYFHMNATQDGESECDFPTTSLPVNSRMSRKSSLWFAHERSTASLQSRGNLEVQIHQETHLA